MIRSPEMNTYYLDSSSGDSVVIHNVEDEIGADSSVDLQVPILPSVEDQLKGHANSITQIFNSIEDARQKYEMKRLLEMELSGVLGIYVGHYKPATERPSGYMPSQ